jgi:MoxR-like ATPase
MNTGILFRKKSPLHEWGIPWLRGGQEHTHTAKRNATGSASVSAILVRALLSCLSGAVKLAFKTDTQVPDGGSRQALWATVESHSSPGAMGGCWATTDWAYAGYPHGGPEKITYHLGVLAVLDALDFLTSTTPAPDHPVFDFWAAYANLLSAYQTHGLKLAIEAALCRMADELYYWLVYRGQITPEVNLLDSLTGCDLNAGRGDASTRKATLNVAMLTDLDALQRATNGTSTPIAAVPTAKAAGGFVGWQGPALEAAILSGENCLLAGPTGTGKTYLTGLIALAHELELVTIEGKEGLTNLDFLGAILPQADNTRRWVDGPLLRAMRLAVYDPVLLFLDEINRVPREHINLLLGLMNPKQRALCELQGVPVTGGGPFYVVEVPMTSEVIWCPAVHLRIVAAGNFGRDYAVYDLDPAVRRRFDTVIEFEYPSYDVELKLICERSGLGDKVASALVKLAGETRRLQSNGELPGSIDTASLLNWARKCARERAATVAQVMEQAKLVWADLVCGRDHTGRVNQGSFDGLGDYLNTLKVLPKGGV